MRYELADLWPDVETVRSIDAILRDEWLLDYQPDVGLISRNFPTPRLFLQRYDEAHARAAHKAGPGGDVDERIV